MKRVDKLGRIVIPMELRQKYNLTEGTKIEFHDAGEGICVKPYDALCRICRSKISDGSTLPLCEACLEKAAKQASRKEIELIRF